MSLIAMVRALTNKHGDTIINGVIMLILAVVTATGGLLWTINARLHDVDNRQDAAAVLTRFQNKMLDRRLSRVWDTDKDQYRRLDRQHGKISANTNAIDVLQARVGSLERRKKNGQAH